MAKRDYQGRAKNGVVILYSDKMKPTAKYMHKTLKGRGLPVELGGLEQKFFAGGEFYARVNTNVRGKVTVYIHDFDDPNVDLVKLGITLDAISRANCRDIVLCVPFLPFVRQDRKKRGEPLSSKFMTNLISMIPGITELYTFDLHAPQVAGFFDDRIRVENVAGHATFMPFIRQRYGLSSDTSIAVRKGGPLDTDEIFSIDDLCAGTTDVGGSKKGRSAAEAIGLTKLVITDKRRDESGAEAMNLIGEPTKRVLLFDDIADSIGSVISACNLMFANGTEAVDAYISHAIMSGQAWERLKSMPNLNMHVTDSIPRSKEVLANNPQFQVIEQKHLMTEIIDSSLRVNGSVSITTDRWIDGTYKAPKSK